MLVWGGSGLHQRLPWKQVGCPSCLLPLGQWTLLHGWLTPFWHQGVGWIQFALITPLLLAGHEAFRNSPQKDCSCPAVEQSVSLLSISPLWHEGSLIAQELLCRIRTYSVALHSNLFSFLISLAAKMIYLLEAAFCFDWFELFLTDFVHCCRLMTSVWNVKVSMEGTNPQATFHYYT